MDGKKVGKKVEKKVENQVKQQSSCCSTEQKETSCC